MRRRDQIDVVDAAVRQRQQAVGKRFLGQRSSQPRAADVPVLAEDATQTASGKNTVPEPHVPLMGGSSQRCGAMRDTYSSAGIPQ